MHSSVRFRVEPVMPAKSVVKHAGFSGVLQFLRRSKGLRFSSNFEPRTSNLQPLSGGNTARVTPVPIPNTEVKPRRADDTARVTVWERRSPPGLISKASVRGPRPFCFCRDTVRILCTSGQLVFCVSPLVESEAQPGPPKAGEKSAQPCRRLVKRILNWNFAGDLRRPFFDISRPRYSD